MKLKGSPNTLFSPPCSGRRASIESLSPCMPRVVPSHLGGSPTTRSTIRAIITAPAKDTLNSYGTFSLFSFGTDELIFCLYSRSTNAGFKEGCITNWSRLLGLGQLGLGLFDSWRVLEKFRVDLIDIALRVALIELLNQL
jgi:hypothetical protein